MQHVFIIGSKGIPAQYGGFETFVDKLVENQTSDQIKYHVACAVEKLTDVQEFDYKGAHCFNIQWRPYGAARAVFYDLDALSWSIDYAKKHKLGKPIFYVLACRIGPFISKYKKQIHALGGQLFVNPDGHEWMRAKWSAPIRKYWKISEQGMVKHADLLICDSKTIEKYIQTEYSRYSPNTTYIAYGADTTRSSLDDNDPQFLEWLSKNDLSPNAYYLVVGRFVPENNYETMIREFMLSSTEKSFVLITGVNDAFLNELKQKTHFDADPRIKFVGTVYDQELLKKIREQAYAYFHGHEVGGTNPSLLEALAATQLNLLLDVGFNKEVALESALYWSKETNSLRNLIEKADQLSNKEIAKLDARSNETIAKRYSWTLITSQYESIFLN